MKYVKEKAMSNAILKIVVRTSGWIDNYIFKVLDHASLDSFIHWKIGLKLVETIH